MVPLDFTINLVLKRVYGSKEIHTKIGRNEIKELLLLFTKNSCFTFENVYQQKNGVAMGSLLVPVLAGTFLVELIPKSITLDKVR